MSVFSDDVDCVFPEWFFDSRFPPRIACVIPVSNAAGVDDLLADIKLENGIVDTWVVNNTKEYIDLSNHRFVDDELMPVEPMNWIDSCNFAAKFIAGMNSYRYICFIPEDSRISDRFFNTMMRTGTVSKSAIVAPMTGDTPYKLQSSDYEGPPSSYEYSPGIIHTDLVSEKGVMIHSALFSTIGMVKNGKKDIDGFASFCEQTDRRELGVVICEGAYLGM